MEFLPASWAAFDGVEAVIFHNAPLDSLGEAQVGAMEKWVAGGGTVVVSGGPIWPLPPPGPCGPSFR